MITQQNQMGTALPKSLSHEDKPGNAYLCCHPHVEKILLSGVSKPLKSSHLLLFWECILVDNLDWTQTQNPPDSASQVLRLQLCASMPSSRTVFLKHYLYRPTCGSMVKHWPGRWKLYAPFSALHTQMYTHSVMCCGLWPGASPTHKLHNQN